MAMTLPGNVIALRKPEKLKLSGLIEETQTAFPGKRLCLSQDVEIYPLTPDRFQGQHDAKAQVQQIQNASQVQQAILKAHQKTLQALLASMSLDEPVVPVETNVFFAPPVGFPSRQRLTPLPRQALLGADSPRWPLRFEPDFYLDSAYSLDSASGFAFKPVLQHTAQKSESPFSTATQPQKGFPQVNVQPKSTRFQKTMAALTLASLGGLTLFSLVKTPRKELGRILLNASTFAVTENLMEKALRVLI
jgi:hypothetical protein